MALVKWAVIVLLAAGAAYGSPLVAISPLGHFKCSGACQEAAGEAPPAAVDSLIKFLMEGTTSDATPEVIKESLTESVQEPLEVVLLVVVEKASESNLNVLQEFSTAILGSSATGSSFLGSFMNPDGTDHVSGEALKTQFGGAKVKTAAEIKQIADDDQIIGNGVPDLVITTMATAPADLSATVQQFALQAGGKLALIFVAEAGMDDSVGGPGANADDREVPAMRPPEINSATLMGLLTGALLLLIFIPGFACLWNVEGPLAFEVAERDGAQKKNL